MKTKGISTEQRKTLLAQLANKSRTGEGRQFSVEFEYSRDRDATALADVLIKVFRDACWNVPQMEVLQEGGAGQPTVYVRYHEKFCSPPAAAQIVLAAFALAGLDAHQISGGTSPNCDVCIGVVGS